MMHTIASPCTGICRIEPVSGWCLGCARTLEEIADWPMLTPGEKRKLIAVLPARLAPGDEVGQLPG